MSHKFLVTKCSCPVQQGLLITDLQKVLSPLAHQPVALAVDTAWIVKAAAVPRQRIIYFPSQECKVFPFLYCILHAQFTALSLCPSSYAVSFADLSYAVESQLKGRIFQSSHLYSALLSIELLIPNQASVSNL